jgi:hypothetical protein
VLARLQALPEVALARTDSSGRFFWIEPSGGVAPADAARAATGVLGARARVLGSDEAQAQLAAHRGGDPWLGAGEVMTLSYVEARLLSVRLSGEARRKVGAGPAEGEALAEAIRAELVAAMERVHAEGGRASSGWIYDEWPAIAAAAVGRCAGVLPPEIRRRVGEVLPGLLAG